MEEQAYCLEVPTRLITRVRNVLDLYGARNIVFLDGKPGPSEFQFIATHADFLDIKKAIPSECDIWAI